MARVVVVGSINVDLVVSAERLPAAGETVIGRSFHQALGGKGANQATAASRAGAEVVLVGCVGTDDDGDQAIRDLHRLGVDVQAVRRRGETTGRATIVVGDSGDNMIVVVPGSNAELRTEDLEGSIRSDDVVLVQLEVPLEVVRYALRHARRVGATGILNASPIVPDVTEIAELADLVVVNEQERGALRGDDGEGRAMIVTLGERGAELRMEGGSRRVAGSIVEAVDTTGAGDCFVGVLAAWLTTGADLATAAMAGCAAAGLQVTRPGALAAMPERNEILGQLELGR